MARLNVNRLVQGATMAHRVAFVCTDPATVKAATEARIDIAQAARSTHALLREVRFAWTRSSMVS